MLFVVFFWKAHYRRLSSALHTFLYLWSKSDPMLPASAQKSSEAIFKGLWQLLLLSVDGRVLLVNFQTESTAASRHTQIKGFGQHAAPSTGVSCFSVQMQSFHDCPTETGTDTSGCPAAAESGCISRFPPRDIPADCYFVKHTEPLVVLASGAHTLHGTSETIP